MIAIELQTAEKTFDEEQMVKYELAIRGVDIYEKYFERFD